MVKEQRKRQNLKESKRKMKLETKKNQNGGITLIALVVTIVVLLILAGITITMVLGEDGIIAQAKLAAEKTKQAEEKQMEDLRNLEAQLDYILDDGGTGGSSTGGTTPTETPTPEPTPRQPQIKDYLDEVISEKENTTVYDEFDNPVTIPAGFHIVTPKEDATVDYDYLEEGSEIPTVQDGIVVADEDGNQFVWIPVGEGEKAIKNKSGDTNGTTTEIKLARRTFNSDGSINEELTDGTALDQYYTEDTSSNHGSYENEIAKDIDEFKKNTEQNRGYYLARYEAGVTNYDKENAKAKSNSEKNTEWTWYEAEENKTLKLVSKAKEQVWNYITQNKASEVARAMYTSNEFTTDLVNSYAWDTAIVFIQKYSEEKDYAKEYSANSTGPAETGTTSDKVCNIYDMASNCFEWTTETSARFSGSPCVSRGGVYGATLNATDWRYNVNTTWAVENKSFRPVLYVK